MRTLLVAPSLSEAIIGELDALLRGRYEFREPARADYESAEAQLLNSAPELVLVVLDGDRPDLSLDIVRRLRAIGAARLLAIGYATDPKAILRIMHAGVEVYLDRAELAAELGEALVRLNATRVSRAQVGHVLACLSTAGGCGGSTLAANLAVILARECGTCNLIDLNPGKADLGPQFDLKPQYTIADLCRNEDRLDRSMYDKLLADHPSGVRLLAAPREFEDVRSVSAGGISRALGLARKMFAQVVVDLEDCFHEEQAVVLEQATRIFLVCRLDFTTVRSTRQVLAHLEARSVPRDRIEIVANHFGLPNELTVPEAEEGIGCKISHFVPHDPETMIEANNTGVPAAIKAFESPVAQSMARIVGLDAPATPAPRTLARLQTWFRGSVGPRLKRSLSRIYGASTTTAVADPTKEIYTSHESVSAQRHNAGPGSCPA